VVEATRKPETEEAEREKLKTDAPEAKILKTGPGETA